MKTIEIIGKNYRGTAHTHIGCRGVIFQEGKILLAHEHNSNWYLIPGGGAEPGESPEECCIREMLEETGCQVKLLECFLKLTEYYGDRCYISYYFRCEALSQGSPQLTPLEAERGLIPEWVDFSEAEAIFADYVNITDYEEKRSSYQREHRAILAFREQYL
jgi:8-oxo-dGTP pyrophosphatase MutT (NUDIX family)